MVMPTQKGDGQTCMPSGQRLHHKTEPESKCSRCSVLHPTPFPGSALKWPAQSVQSLSQVFSSKRGGRSPRDHTREEEVPPGSAPDRGGSGGAPLEPRFASLQHREDSSALPASCPVNVPLCLVFPPCLCLTSHSFLLPKVISREQLLTQVFISGTPAGGRQLGKLGSCRMTGSASSKNNLRGTEKIQRGKLEMEKEVSVDQ